MVEMNQNNIHPVDTELETCAIIVDIEFTELQTHAIIVKFGLL